MRTVLTVAIVLLSACAAPTPADHCADLCAAAPLMAEGIDCESECTAFVYDEWSGGPDRCPTEAAWAWAETEYSDLGARYCESFIPMCSPIDYESHEVRERFSCAGEE